MQNSLSYVVFGAVAFSLVISVLLLLTRGQASAYDKIGEGGIERESDAPDWGAMIAPDSPAARAEREQEIRQLLKARSERGVRRGEDPLDIDVELAKLTASDASEPASVSSDAGLTEEVRQLVTARNERRVRKGMEPLDVEAEVARTLRELSA